MSRRALLAGALAALTACEPGDGGVDLAFHDLEATPLSGMPQPISLATSSDRRVAFGAATWRLWVQQTLGSGGRYEEIPASYVAMVGEHLVVAGGDNGGSGAVFYTSDDGWTTLTEAGTSPLSILHLSVDGDRVALADGDTVMVMDTARLLAGAGPEEAEVTLRWEPDVPAFWEGTAVATSLQGDVLRIAAGDGVRGYDLREDPPVLLHVLGDHDAYGLHLEGDTLLVLQNEDGVKIDVSDPYSPRIAGRLLGGEAVDVVDGYAFGVSSTWLTVSRLGAPSERPEPLQQLELEACEAVAALVDRVLVACDDQGTFELAPLDP